MTSVGYGQRFPTSSMGKGVAIVAAIFGAFYMAMPLTIIGSTFYEIYVEQEEKRHDNTMKQRLRSAAYQAAKRAPFMTGDGSVPVDSGYEHLCRALHLQPEHRKVVEAYLEMSRAKIHQIHNLMEIVRFKEKHTAAMEVLALYLHEENSEEMARQHVHMAHKASGGDPSKTLSAFKHASEHMTMITEGEEEMLQGHAPPPKVEPQSPASGTEQPSYV